MACFPVAHRVHPPPPQTSLLRSLKPTQRLVEYMEQLDPCLAPSLTIAERERAKMEEDDDDPPSDELGEAFGF